MNSAAMPTMLFDNSINWGPLVAYLLATFFVCGIPFGKIIARAKGVDIQKVGSGNIGTTNVAREIGKGAAALTLLLDAGKGALATGLASWLFQQPDFVLTNATGISVAPTGTGGWLVGLVMVAAVWGHIFSPFLHFHGGKGIAVGVGSLLGFLLPVALIELFVFIVLVAATKRVSIGSITVAAALPVVAGLAYGWNWPLVVTLAVAGWTVVWAHRSNMRKLAEGKESVFAFHKAGTGTDLVAGSDDAAVDVKGGSSDPGSNSGEAGR